MGGSSNTNSTSTSKTELKDTTTTNPYMKSHTDDNGSTTTSFNDGTALQNVYNWGNSNIQTLLNDYLNPSLDSTTNRAKLAAYNNTQQDNLQNNIINPLSQNHMLRSSQATDMYNNLSNQAGDYANQLLSESQSNSADMINNLLNWYMQGYDTASSEQANSLNASTAGATTNTSSSGTTK